MSDYNVIGKQTPRVDALEKVNGTAVFSDDIRFPQYGLRQNLT